MSWIKSIVLSTMLVLLFTLYGQAQQVRLVEGKLSDSGKPLANQTLLLEGQKELRWVDFLTWRSDNKVEVIALTDDKGFLQFVDLPPGKYTLKLVRAGEETVSLKTFTLQSGYQKAEISTKLSLKDLNPPTKVIGITADGQQVFSNGVDAKARRVTHQATATSTGLMEDGTSWYLSREEKK